MKKNFCTYILFSEKFDKFYIGHTGNIDIRLFQHNNSDSSSYTAKFRPWILMATIYFNNRADAMKTEKYLKKKPRDFLKRVIEDHNLKTYIQNRFNSVS